MRTAFRAGETNEARGAGSALSMGVAMNWRGHFREHWDALKAGRPGRRFRDRYDATRRETRSGSTVARVAMMLGGLLCILIGLVLTVMPGPAIVFFFLAGTLIATESRTVARGMDWAEVHGRQALAWGKRRWRRASKMERIAGIAIAGLVTLGAAWIGYRWLMRW